MLCTATKPGTDGLLNNNNTQVCEVNVVATSVIADVCVRLRVVIRCGMGPGTAGQSSSGHTDELEPPRYVTVADIRWTETPLAGVLVELLLLLSQPDDSAGLEKNHGTAHSALNCDIGRTPLVLVVVHVDKPRSRYSNRADDALT